MLYYYHLACQCGLDWSGYRLDVLCAQWAAHLEAQDDAAALGHEATMTTSWEARR